jgi:trigger factor
VRFPDDHPDEVRRGQTRTVRVTLHEVKRQALPALDDAFAREVGEFESLAALTEAVKTDMTADAERQADANVRQQLVTQLVQANDIPAPGALVHRVMHAIAKMYEIPDEQVHGMEAQLEPMAKQQVQRDLLLDAVAQQQPQLKASEAELDARVAALAGARKVPVSQLYGQLQQQGRLADLERAITEEKTFAWLLSQSTISDAKA